MLDEATGKLNTKARTRANECPLMLIYTCVVATITRPHASKELLPSNSSKENEKGRSKLQLQRVCHSVRVSDSRALPLGVTPILVTTGVMLLCK